jgi:AAA ATPase-like protein
VNKSFAFFGREREINELRALDALRKHVLVVGPAGIGKTALLRQVRQRCPVLVCEETSSLRRICDSLERQLGWAHCKLNVIERKNRLLAYLIRRGEPVAFDHVAHTVPRVARFIAHLAEQIPIWIACRSDRPHEIGHVWPELYRFARIELTPLTEVETRMLIDEAVAQGNIQADAREHTDELHRISAGNPRILEELLIELAAREYKIDSSFGLDLLDLDRRIHEIDLAVKATATTSSK